MVIPTIIRTRTRDNKVAKFRIRIHRQPKLILIEKLVLLRSNDATPKGLVVLKTFKGRKLVREYISLTEQTWFMLADLVDVLLAVVRDSEPINNKIFLN